MKIQSEIRMAGTLKQIVEKIGELPGPTAVVEVGLTGYNWPVGSMNPRETVQSQLEKEISAQYPRGVIWKSEMHFYGKCQGVVSQTDPTYWRPVFGRSYDLPAAVLMEECQLMVVTMDQDDSADHEKRHQVVEALRKSGARSIVMICITYSSEEVPAGSSLVPNAALQHNPPTPDGLDMLVLLHGTD